VKLESLVIRRALIEARRCMRIGICLVVSTLAACASTPAPLAPWSPPTDDFVRSDRTHLVDQTGRVMVFRGVNARVQGVFDVQLDPARCPPPSDVLEAIPPLTDDDLARMRTMGFDALRLPIDWSAIEPTQGNDDDAYLMRVEDVVARAAAHDIRVLIDFHADGWSKDLGEDGAPTWATVPTPTTLLCGPLTDLGTRRMNTLTNYTTFFDDTIPTSVALHQAYGAMVAHVAARFADEPDVLGYDLFNEPLPNDAAIERFYARILPALRAVDTRHLAFFEPSAVRNLTNRGPIATTPFPDANGVYAVHLYTLSFSDPNNELATITRARLQPNVMRAVSEAASYQAPLFAGEWGVTPSSPGSSAYVGFMYDLFDSVAASSTVWLWKEESQGGWGFYDVDASGQFTERPAVFAAHTRPWAEVIAGTPMGATYDATTQTYTLTYVGRNDLAPNVLRVPASMYPSFVLRCDGATRTATRDAMTSRVEVVCAGAGMHVVTLTPS
jgi:endoglycosylceramidase